MGKEKKEIGKLLELLNEYEKERIEKINSEGKLMVKLSFKPYTEESLTNEAYRSCWLEICSKYYGFIKWLVDNDKIDRDKELKESGLFRMYFYDLEYVKNYDRLVMWLSVEDKPIDFLISILK